jgi:hypothetical protein
MMPALAELRLNTREQRAAPRVTARVRLWPCVQLRGSCPIEDLDSPIKAARQGTGNQSGLMPIPDILVVSWLQSIVVTLAIAADWMKEELRAVSATYWKITGPPRDPDGVVP